MERFKKLTPLLDLVNQDLELKIPPKQEPQVKIPTAPVHAPSTSNTPNIAPQNTATAPTKKPPQKKRTYTKKNAKNNANANINTAPNNNQQPNMNASTPILPNGNGAGSYQAGSLMNFNSFQGNRDGSTDANGSETQPILL